MVYVGLFLCTLVYVGSCISQDGLRWFIFVYVGSIGFSRWFRLVYVRFRWFALVRMISQGGLRWFMFVYVGLRWFV